MTVTTGDTPDGPAAPERPRTGAAILVRRAHMFLGLFLTPWMCMYALSTLGMLHREFASSFYRTKTPALVTERELDYSRKFPAEAMPQPAARQILRDLDLDGTHQVSGGTGGKPLTIERQHPLGLRRITFDPVAGRITVQREEYRSLTFLDRLHRRRGYQQPYALEDTWAFSVDTAVFAMVFWSLSGIWLWWELRATRVWGALALGSGLTLFALFLILI